MEWEIEEVFEDEEECENRRLEVESGVEEEFEVLAKDEEVFEVSAEEEKELSVVGVD